MTREEAIKWLKEHHSIDLNTQDDKAHKMAIKALEQESILDKIRAEFIARYPKNYMGELELGGRSCEFSLNQILQIIDKYRAESENKE